MKYLLIGLKKISQNSLISKFISSASEKYISSLISVIATLLLTYLYGLELIGFVGVFSIFVAIGHILSSAGIGQIILRYDMTAGILAALFLVNAFIGCCIFLSFILLGDIFSDWANVENFDQVFKFYCSIVVFNAVSMVPVAIVTKIGNFKILNIANLLAMILSIFIVLTTVDKENYFWASLYFVYFYGFRAFFLLIYVRKMVWAKPNFLQSRQYIKFGSYVFSANVLKTASENTLSFLLPSLVGLQYAGFYGLLVKVRELIVGSLSHAIHRVIYVERSKGNYSNSYPRNSALFLTIFASLFWVCLAIFIDDFLIYFEVRSLNNPDLTLKVFLFVLITTLFLPAYNIFTQMIQYSDVRFFSYIENAYALSFLFIAFFYRDTPGLIFTLLGLVVIFFAVIAILKFEKTNRLRLISLVFFLGFFAACYLLIWWLLK